MTKFWFLILFISSHVMGQDTLNWNFYHPVKKQWINAGSHGSVQEKLIEIGELPDPFYGKNELLFSWIEEYKWDYKSTFLITEEMLKKDFIEIEFPLIDTYAELYLNDSLIGFAQNSFRPYRIEVKKLLQLGENKISAVFYPPVLYHEESFKKAKYKLPAPNDVHKIAIAPYTRKPQYQFGWDWSLRMNTIGFLKPVIIRSYNTAIVTSSNLQTKEIFENSATLSFSIQFFDYPTEKLIWKSKLFGDQSFDPNLEFYREEQIDNPNLWWPRGQGEQFLYEDEWQLINESGELIDKRKVKFGIRQSELVMETDKWGTSYEIHFNNRPVFCKGADYIPQDIFPSRVKKEDIREMVETMAESNFNMVRVWGGGYYPDDVFYEICDELGIMVWQDFMFACAMYPGDPEFLANVQGELEYQIPRIASHPSLTLFNGNNEVDVAWKNWGFQARYLLFGQDAKEIEESYDRLFKRMIPSLLLARTNSPYIHTSPLSNWGKDEFYNHGSQHYWGVWHGKDPIEDFGKKIGRFNAEYGFQSFPEFSTLSYFSEKSEWNLESEVMKHHQKSYVGNGMIEKHAKILYGNPKSFEDFVYYSQLTQATAVSMAVSGHRLDAPRCMGTLYWQLNDCWTAPSWSSIDYFGNWKALQYRIKEDYEDVGVLSKENDKGVTEYFLVSDQIDTFMCEIKYLIYDLNGKKIVENNLSQLIKGNESEKLCIDCLNKEIVNKNYVIQFDWKTNTGEPKSRVFSNTSNNYAIAERKDFTIEIMNLDTLTNKATIILKNEKFLRNFWLYSNTVGVKFNNNFLDLIPGVHEFEIEFQTTPIISDFNFKWM